MKNGRFTTATTKAVLIIAALLAFTASTFAQTYNSYNYTFTEKHIKNLLSGMQSDNEGLKKSCIYYAGEYKLTEAVDVLIEELKTEDDPNIRMLISFSLFMIGEERGINAVYASALTETNLKARGLLFTIVKEYQREQSELAATEH